MSQDDPTYYPRAPVVESVIGVQFDALMGFGNAHFGAFWKSVLSGEWTKTKDSPPVADQFETFENSPLAATPRLVIRTAGPVDRVQFIHQSDDRVVQLQPTRLLINWRKRNQGYPRFQERLVDFQVLWANWSRFCEESAIGDLRPNQWEISYYNHVPRGELWESTSDWSGVLPGLVMSPRNGDLLKFEYQDGEWHFEIPPQRGRLHVSLQRADAGGVPVLRWTQTARGPLNSGIWDDIEAGLRTGHDAIIAAFETHSSAKALDYWRLGHADGI